MADEIQTELARLSDTVRRQAEEVRAPPMLPEIAPVTNLITPASPWYKSDWIWILVVVVLIALVLLYVWWKKRGSKDEKSK